MTNESQAITVQLHAATAELPQRSNSDLLVNEQHCRAGAYGLLASLLRVAPDESALARVSRFAETDPAGDELALSMSMLGLAATSSMPDAVEDEFFNLFIGLGRGELVPYGSWYLTGFLMEKPLSHLRDDLATLGFKRDEDMHEPEDHAAALCEVMYMLIEGEVSLNQQSLFFETHMECWFEHFFADLGSAKSAVFYRAVGRFGAAFTAFEKRYLSMQV